MQRIRERLSYLFPSVASMGASSGPVSWADARAETAVTAVGFAGATMLAALGRGDVPSGAIVSYLDRHLPDLRFAQQVGLQLLLLGEGAVRLDAIFAVDPPPSAAAAAFRKDYAAALRGLREWATPIASAEEAGEALDRLFATLEPAFHPQLLEIESRQGQTVGRLLNVAGELPGLEADASSPGTYLKGPGGDLLPLSPFVRCEEAEVQLFCGMGQQGLRYLAPRRGTMASVSGVRDSSALAEVLLRFGIYRKALALLRPPGHGRGLSPSGSALHATHAQAGVDHIEAGRADLAIPELEAAIRHRPDLPAAVYLLARAFRATGERKRAVHALRGILTRAPHLDRGHELHGDLMAEMGDVEGALAAYRQACEVNPYNRTAPAKRARLDGERRPPARPAARPAEPKPAEAGGEKPAEKAERKLVDEMMLDMTAEARRGAYTPVVGRERELGQLVEILACRRKRHALVLGDPGVGKTALLEELARRMADGNVPAHLKGRRLLLMSVATLLAGAKYRGQFEERVLELVKELQGLDAVVFIDDFHTIVNAGLSRGGTLDTSNLLKPALVRGEIQTVGATSFDEFRANVEKDPSLARCYQVVRLDEPSEEVVAEILRDVAVRLEQTHGVRFAADALLETLPLVKATIRERAMPDKAIDVMERGAAHASLRAGEGGSPTVTRDDLVEALASISGVPVEKVAGRTTERLWSLEEALAARVVGQDHAVAAVARVVRAARLHLSLRAHRPDGVFLFVGPTGVGKTELARALAERLFGDEERLIRIDMSEYMEKISGSRLIGSSPGYVGYNDQNQLTDLVRRNPCSLVLLDEVEKADAQMMNLFLQVFDAGRLTDGKGRTVHFANTTIVMTSNVGSRLYARGPLGYGIEGDKVSRAQLMKEIRHVFPPEFLNRIDEIVFFHPLARASVERIAALLLKEVTERMAREGRELRVAEDVLEILADEGFDAEYGARQLARTIAARVLNPLASVAARVSPERWRGFRRIELSASPSEGSLPLPDAPAGRPVIHATFEDPPAVAEASDLLIDAKPDEEAREAGEGP